MARAEQQTTVPGESERWLECTETLRGWQPQQRGGGGSNNSPFPSRLSFFFRSALPLLLPCHRCQWRRRLPPPRSSQAARARAPGETPECGNAKSARFSHGRPGLKGEEASGDAGARIVDLKYKCVVRWNGNRLPLLRRRPRSSRGACARTRRKKRQGGVCVGARARARRALLFGRRRPFPLLLLHRGPERRNSSGQRCCRRRCSWRRLSGRRAACVAGWRDARDSVPTLDASRRLAPHPPPRKGGTSNRSRPGRGHARRPRRESRRRAAYLRQKGALCIPLPSALGARAPRGSRPPRRSCRRREFVAAVVVLWRARFELDLKVTSSSARMVASPPPPLLSSVPPQQQQQQQRYGLPPAPLSPLLPAPSTPTIMSTAGVPAPERPTPSRASEIRRVSCPCRRRLLRAREMGAPPPLSP